MGSSKEPQNFAAKIPAAERSFSILKLTKTYVGPAMVQEFVVVTVNHEVSR